MVIMLNIVLQVRLTKGVKEQDLDFLAIKFVFLATIQKVKSIKCFLEACEKGLKGHVLKFLFTPMHVVKSRQQQLGNQLRPCG